MGHKQAKVKVLSADLDFLIVLVTIQKITLNLTLMSFFTIIHQMKRVRIRNLRGYLTKIRKMKRDSTRFTNLLLSTNELWQLLILVPLIEVA